MKEEKYDVVVVGSGMGGMCAAALAVKNGYRTLVVESRQRLGGRYSTEEIDGCKMVTGASYIHYSCWVPTIFKEVGAKLELRDASEVFYQIRGKEYPLPLKNRVTALLDIVNKVEVEKAKLVGGIVKEVAKEKILGAFKKGVAEAEKEGGPTLREWLLRYSDNEELHQIFDAICIGWVIAHAYELPASQFFYFMSVMKGMNDVGMSPKGNLSNIEELARVVKSNGDAWIDCQAKRIVTKKGSVTGVVVQSEGNNETEIPCKVVISNVGPKKTVELAGENNFDEGYLADMRVRLRPVPITLIHVVSDKPLCMPGMEHGALLVAGARRITGAVPLTHTCPELAPPGQHLLHLSASPPSTLVRFDPEEERRQCTLDLEELFPDFKKHGRILKMETRNVDHDLPECRTWQGPLYTMPKETPLRNLFNVGDGVVSPGLSGTSGCAESAKRVMETVKKYVSRT